MARRVRSLYRWKNQSGQEKLEHDGWISEAELRAWEYQPQSSAEWRFTSGSFRDTVHRWRTRRPDLRGPEELFVGDYEETAR